MRPEIITCLSQITEQEQYNLVITNPFNRKLYAKSGRFIIEHHHMSDLTFKDPYAPLCIIPHPRFREFPAHSHDYIEIMYVCNGSITHVFDNETVRLQSDEMILIAKNSTHSILNTGSDDIGINLVISTELFESLLATIKRKSNINGRALSALLQQNDIPYLKFSATDSISVRALIETIISMVVCEGNTNGYLLEQALLLLLSQLAFYTDKDEPHMPDSKSEMKKKMLNYINTTYRTATLSDAAKMFKLSVPYISRWTKENFGKSFKELLMEKRFSMACHLLCATELSINDIIEHIGYQDRSYFHRQFKRRYGMSPDTYRKQKRHHSKSDVNSLPDY